MNVMTDAGTRVVTVCRGTRRVDVRLPAVVPVAELMPGLLDLLEGDLAIQKPAAQGAPRTWELVPVGRPPLDWGNTLIDAGVTDGDVLYLTEKTAAATGAAIYDVADLAAARSELAGPTFGRDHALVAWPAVAAVVGLAAAAAPWLGLDLPAWALTAIGVVLLAATMLQRVRPLPATPAGRLVGGAVAVAGVAAAAVAAVGWAHTQPTAVQVGVGAAVATLAGVAVWVVCGQCLVGAFAATVGIGLGLAAGLEATPLSVTHVALAVGALAFVAVGAMPRLSVVTGGMAELDLLVRRGGSPDEQDVARAVTRSSRVLTGLLGGCAVAVAGAAVTLAAGTPSALVVAALLATGLLVRAQSFTRPPHRLVVRGPALVAAATIPVVAGVPAEIAVLGAVVIPLAVTAGLLVRWPDEASAARLRLAVGWTEVIIVAALVPAIATAAGLFDWLAGGSA